MPSNINRLPAGLQDILGNVASGDNPSVLSDAVLAQFDIMPLWLTDKLVTVKANAAAAVVGDSAFVEVPERKLWIPIALAGTVQATAIGDQLRLAFLGQAHANANLIGLGESERLVSVAALELIRYGITFPQRVAYPSGWRFYSIMTTMIIAAGTRPLETQILTYEVSI